MANTENKSNGNVGIIIVMIILFVLLRPPAQGPGPGPDPTPDDKSEATLIASKAHIQIDNLATNYGAMFRSVKSAVHDEKIKTGLDLQTVFSKLSEDVIKKSTEDLSKLMESKLPEGDIDSDGRKKLEAIFDALILGYDRAAADIK